MLGLILTIENVIALVQRGLTTASAVAAAVQAGHTAVVGPMNTPLSAEDVVAHVDAAIAAAGDAGAAAAGRIEHRHDGPDGTP